MTSDTPNTMRQSPSALERKSTVLVQNAAAVTTDVTRRMICGGLAGMIAKVRVETTMSCSLVYSQCKSVFYSYSYSSREDVDRYCR